MALGQISAVMITRDAAATLADSLASLRGFPEVVVFDNGSTDETVAIAHRFDNVKLERGEFNGFGVTKNHAVSLAAHDWVFVLDSDERPNAELLRSMDRADLKDLSAVYYVDRHNYFMGRHVRHAGWGRDWLARLYHRDRHRHTDALVHEKVLPGADSREARLEGALEHLAVRELGQFLVKVNRYSELNRLGAKRVHAPAVIFLRAAWAFFRTYLLRKGFLEGWRGLVIAWSDADGVFFKYMKPYADREADKSR
ncbi:hypothetical protein BH24PSE2_BH24PSE2_05630 [soil metagenome]